MEPADSIARKQLRAEDKEAESWLKHYDFYHKAPPPGQIRPPLSSAMHDIGDFLEAAKGGFSSRKVVEKLNTEHGQQSFVNQCKERIKQNKGHRFPNLLRKEAIERQLKAGTSGVLGKQELPPQLKDFLPSNWTPPTHGNGESVYNQFSAQCEAFGRTDPRTTRLDPYPPQEASQGHLHYGYGNGYHSQASVPYPLYKTPHAGQQLPQQSQGPDVLGHQSQHVPQYQAQGVQYPPSDMQQSASSISQQYGRQDADQAG